MDEMLVWPPPDRRHRSNESCWQAFSRDQGPPGDVASESRLLRSPKDRTSERMDAVRANQSIANMS